MISLCRPGRCHPHTNNVDGRAIKHNTETDDRIFDLDIDPPRDDTATGLNSLSGCVFPHSVNGAQNKQTVELVES